MKIRIRYYVCLTQTQPGFMCSWPGIYRAPSLGWVPHMTQCPVVIILTFVVVSFCFDEAGSHLTQAGPELVT